MVHTPSSALTFSLILFCDKKSSQQCTMLAAVAVYEMLKELGIHRIGIKWPMTFWLRITSYVAFYQRPYGQEKNHRGSSWNRN